MPRDWEEVRITVIRPGPIPTSSPCGNTIPDDDRLTVSLPAGARSVAQTHPHTHMCTYTYCKQSLDELCAECVCSRFMIPPQPVCLERGVTYTLRFEFSRYQDANSILNGAANALLLVDSVR